MTQAGFLATVFPSSRIIHMVRDGRAVSHSLVSRNLEFPPFSNKDHKQNLKQWSHLATGYQVILFEGKCQHLLLCQDAEDL